MQSKNVIPAVEAYYHVDLKQQTTRSWTLLNEARQVAAYILYNHCGLSALAITKMVGYKSDKHVFSIVKSPLTRVSLLSYVSHFRTIKDVVDDILTGQGSEFEGCTPREPKTRQRPQPNRYTVSKQNRNLARPWTLRLNDKWIGSYETKEQAEQASHVPVEEARAEYVNRVGL